MASLWNVVRVERLKNHVTATLATVGTAAGMALLAYIAVLIVDAAMGESIRGLFAFSFVVVYVAATAAVVTLAVITPLSVLGSWLCTVRGWPDAAPPIVVFLFCTAVFVAVNLPARTSAFRVAATVGNPAGTLSFVVGPGFVIYWMVLRNRRRRDRRDPEAAR